MSLISKIRPAVKKTVKVLFQLNHRSSAPNEFTFPDITVEDQPAGPLG